MRAPWSYLPALPACFGIMAGIVVCQWLPWAAVAVATFTVFIALYAVKRHYLAFFFAMMAAGAVTAAIHTPERISPELFQRKATYTARILTATEMPYGIVYHARLIDDGNKRCGGVTCRITVNSYANEMEPGAVCRFSGRLRPVESATAVVPHMPDPDKQLRRQGIGAKIFLMGTDIREVRAPSGFDAFVNRLRRATYNAVVTAPVSGSTAAFLAAVILGDDTLLIPDNTEVYRSLGVAHLLALSGLHVGIIATIFGWLMLPLRAWRRSRVLRSLVAALLVWIYVLITGFGAPVLRAAIMITVALAATVVQRSASAWNSIAIAIALMLLVWPHWLFTAGFQLSVAAVVSILLFAPLVPLTLKRRPWLYHSITMLVVPVAAMLGTGIVSMYYFGYFPLYFLPANILCGLLFPFIVGGGFVLMLLNMCGWSFGILGWCVTLCHNIMDSGLAFLSELPHPTVHGIYFSGWVMVPYIFVFLLLAWTARAPRDWRRMTLLTAALLFTIATAILTSPGDHAAEVFITSQRGRTEVVAYDNGAAMLRSFPADSVTTDSARYAPYLASRNIDQPIQRCEMHSDAIDISDAAIVAGSTLVMVADSASTLPTSVTAPDANRRYWLVTRNYNNSIDDLQQIMRADTVIFGADVHPSRLRRWMRECGDTIPMISLRDRSVAL